MGKSRVTFDVELVSADDQGASTATNVGLENLVVGLFTHMVYSDMYSDMCVVILYSDMCVCSDMCV